MALITCPDCENRISDQAASCPHCGRPVSAQSSMKVGREKAIELTSKRLKLISICSVAAIVIGLVTVVSAVNAEASTVRPWGSFLFVAGLISYIVNRVRIYWHHR